MSVKDRLIEYLSYKKVGRNAFEKQSGISTGYITNIKNSVGSEILAKIITAAPDLNRDWLLYGEGEMLKKDNNFEKDCNSSLLGYSIPLLPISAQGGTLNDFVTSVKDNDCEMVISPIKGCDFAIPVTGDSMAPEYPNGAQVLIKKINTSAFIEWGKVYVLDTCNGSIIKEVHQADNDETCVICYSINPDPKYKPFKVSFDDIYGMYRVVMSMALK